MTESGDVVQSHNVYTCNIQAKSFYAEAGLRGGIEPHPLEPKIYSIN